jgi:hypothetical protein
MKLLGAWNWHAPRCLDWLPRLSRPPRFDERGLVSAAE